MSEQIEIPEITKASVDYALALPKEYPAEWIVAHRKGFQAGALWNQNRIDELEEIICKLEKQVELMIDNYYGNEI